MAVSVELDLGLLRSGKSKDVTSYLMQLLKKHTPIDVCKALLAAAESEQLPPMLFEIFLNIVKSLDCIMLCLHQTFSIIIRSRGIKHYGIVLSSNDHWREAWKALGGLEGILQYLSTISVREVQAFCKALGKCNFGQQKSAQRAKAIEELIKAMNPALYPDMSVKKPDKRPLGGYAGHMVLACSPEFVYSLMVDETKQSIYSHCSKSNLVKAFSGSARKCVETKIWSSKEPVTHGTAPLFLTDLVHSEPSLPGQEKYFSATMEYSERILEDRLKSKKAEWPHVPTEADVYFGLLERCIKTRMTKKRLHSIYDLGMRIVTASPELLSGFTSRKEKFWTPIIRFWIKWPGHWEDLLFRGLQLGFEGKSNIPQSFATFIQDAGFSDFTEDKLWAVLRIFYLYIPPHAVDIDTMEQTEVFVKSSWETGVLDRLPTKKVVSLLQMLLRVNPRFNFLSCQRHNSILNVSSIHDRHNFNGILYLIERQLDSPVESHQADALERLAEAYADYKKKSALSKEQQDRAQYARATGLFAIASRSLKVYGEYVMWLARFIRDPFTVKVLFSQKLLANPEVTALLSGIPEKITEETTLAVVSKNVSEADQILMVLNDHHKTAKREPAYYSPDWRMIDNLVPNILQARLSRVKAIQKSLNASQGELYGQLWSNTLARFSQPGNGTMTQVEPLISGLVSDLPSKLLLNLTKAVQETEDMYRAKKAEGEEAENELGTIGRLANRCLIALAKGDNPSLAGQIIIKTILDHPEDSSWHRQMLRRGFFNRLPAASAQQLLLDFADKIGEKLEEQSYVRVGETANTSSNVKVSTVKYLAQILQGAEFLSAESSIDVLVELFKVAAHPDIREATLESMLSTLTDLATAEMQDSSTDISKSKNPLTRKILAALDSVVPVIGSIDERRVPTEQEWKEAESDLTRLPSLGTEERSLWTKLLIAAKKNKSLQTYFVQRLLLPGLETSIKGHRRWLTLFLKKHDAGFSIDRLPAIPADPAMLATVFADFQQITPYRFFECWVKYLKFQLESADFLLDFMSKLEGDEKVNAKPDVLHFISVFGGRPLGLLEKGACKFATLINHSWKPSILDANQAVTLSHMHDTIIDHLHFLLRQYPQHVCQWGGFLHFLKHPTGQQDWQRWRSDCYPLIERVVALVEKFRTPQWSADPQRTPSILPTTTKPKLLLLDYPLPGDSTATSDRQAIKLGHQLVDLLSALLKDANVLVKPDKIWADIKTVSERITDRDRIQVGLVLGTLSRLKPVEESLRVSLAIEFLNRGLKAVEKDKTLKQQLATILQRWQKSQVEDVRETVIDLESKSKNPWKVAFSKDEGIDENKD